VIAYPAMLDVPTELVAFVAELLAAERLARGTRALSCTDQALFALVWFRENREVALIGRGLGISQATSYRYLDEAIGVLAARAPDLHAALARGHEEGWSHVVLDGKVVDTDRLRVKTLSKKGKIIDAWYSGKTHDFGGNIQALFRPDGLPVWVSPVEPGGVHDLTAACEHVLGARTPPPVMDYRPLPIPATKAQVTASTPRSSNPPNGSELDITTRTRNMLLRSLRCLGERGFALLTQRWRTLQHVTLSPSKISKIARAALVLTAASDPDYALFCDEPVCDPTTDAPAGVTQHDGQNESANRCDQRSTPVVRGPE